MKGYNTPSQFVQVDLKNIFKSGGGKRLTGVNSGIKNIFLTRPGQNLNVFAIPATVW